MLGTHQKNFQTLTDFKNVGDIRHNYRFNKFLNAHTRRLSQDAGPQTWRSLSDFQVATPGSHLIAQKHMRSNVTSEKTNIAADCRH